MLGDVTFGQYYDARSFMHKVDPRVKILLLIAYITAVFMAKNFLALAAVLFFLIVAVIFSSVPIGAVLKSIKAIYILILFTATLNVLFTLRKRAIRSCSGWLRKKGL